MIVLTCPVKSIIVLEYFEILLTIAIILSESFVANMRERFGGFYGVMIAFQIGFLLTNLRILYAIREMKAKSFAIESIKFSNTTNALYDGGQSSLLNQSFALIFKNTYGIFTIVKIILSILFLLSFTWAYEITKSKIQDEHAGSIDFESAKETSHYLFLAWIISALLFVVLRLAELVMFCLVRQWASTRINFNIHNTNALMEYDDDKLKQYFKQLSTSEPGTPEDIE